MKHKIHLVDLVPVIATALLIAATFAAIAFGRPYRPPPRPDPDPGPPGEVIPDPTPDPTPTPAPGGGKWNAVTGQEYPYQLFVPTLQPSKKYPLVVQLHGSGKQGTDNRTQISYPPAQYFAGPAQKLEPHYVLAPQMSGGWQPAKLKALIDRITGANPIDVGRIYCTGQSMGGFGTGDTAVAYPELFAAIVPVAGTARSTVGAAKIAQLPYWGLHGKSDRTVPIASHTAFINALRAAGGNPGWTPVDGGHNIWGNPNVYSETFREGGHSIGSWLLQWRRGQVPVPPPPPDDPGPDPPPDEPPPPTGDFPSVPRWLILQGVDKTNVSDADLSNPKVGGLSIRVSWSSIGNGPYNWTWLDSQIARAKSRNKSAMIRVMAGVHAPGGGGDRVITTEYIDQWVKLVAALGQRYNSNPTVVMLHMAGPTDQSAEMFLRFTSNPSQAQIEQTYTAWKRSIDAFSSAFPDKYVCLNASRVFTSNDGLLQRVSDYAKTTLGKRCSLQTNSLKADTSPSYAPIPIIKAWTGMKGFQHAVAQSNDPARFGGTFDQSIVFGDSVGAKYYEYYGPDTRFLATAP